MTTNGRLKVAIVGSREWPYPKIVEGYVEGLVDIEGKYEVVTGGARGVDRTAEMFARGIGLVVDVIKADWDHHGKRAGYLRNVQIVEAADRVVAFWDGKSKGTKHTIDLALSEGKDLQVIFPPGGTP